MRVTAFWWPTLSGIPALRSTACWPACMSSTGCAARSTVRLCWPAASGSGCGWSTGSRRGWWMRSLPMHTTAPRARPGCGRRMSGSAPVWDKRQHKTDRTGWHRVSCIVALTAGNENGKDASFSQLLYEETDGEGTSFCKEVWSFWLFVQKTCESKDKVLNWKQGTCMVNLRGCTNEDTGRR